MGVSHNNTTDGVLEESDVRLFVREEDAASRVDVYVAGAGTISEDWQELSLSPVADSKAQHLPNELHDSKVTSQWARGAPASPPYSANSNRMTLRNLNGLRKYVRMPRAMYAFYIRKRNSLSELSISSSFFDQLCEEVSVPRTFRDHLRYFGRRPYEVEIAPPPFSLEVLDAVNPSNLPQWEAMGIIRFMEENGRVNPSNPSWQWSLRQTAVYYRFDPQRPRAILLFASLSNSAEALLDGVWASAEQYDTQSPWQTLHTLYHFAARNWRPYVVALMHEVERHEEELLGTSPDNSGPVPLPGGEERQALLMLEKQVSTAKLVLRATKADVEFLQAQLQSYESEVSEEDITKIVQTRKRQLAEIVRHLNVNLLRFDDLQSRLQSLATLLSSFLDLNGGFALQALAQESKRENETMRKLNERMAGLAEKNAEEAVTVTVLAILTMIYLPFTVVSNFFSTSFVGTSSNSIFITRDCWILFVITVPLTFITIYVWRTWTQLKVRRRYPIWWPLLGLKQKRRQLDRRSTDVHVHDEFRTIPAIGDSP